MSELQRTGFFREMPHGAPDDPRLADARHAAPSPHEDRIAGYLDAGHVYIATPGLTPDVFDPGTSIGPPHYLTDGRFVWPGDLAHYVRSYHVRLEGAFLEHMMALGWAVPADVDVSRLAPPRQRDSTAAASDGPPDAKPDAKTDASSGSDLASAFAAFVGSLSSAADAAGIDTEALKQSLADASKEVVRATETLGDELRRTLDVAGAQIRTQLSASLRSVTAWADKPPEERAAQLQSLAAKLEARLDEALAPQRRAEDAERTTRLSAQIRSSIAARLRERGLVPREPGAADRSEAATQPEAADKSGDPTPPEDAHQSEAAESSGGASPPEDAHKSDGATGVDFVKKPD